jgi:hypothetical protein
VSLIVVFFSGFWRVFHSCTGFDRCPVPDPIRSKSVFKKKKNKTKVCACADRIDLETSLATGTDRLEDIPASIGSSNKKIKKQIGSFTGVQLGHDLLDLFELSRTKSLASIASSQYQKKKTKKASAASPAPTLRRPPRWGVLDRISGAVARAQGQRLSGPWRQVVSSIAVPRVRARRLSGVRRQIGPLLLGPNLSE